MITRGLDASIRCASDAGANPPKTTAWMAPSREMARRAKRAAGIMGTWEVSYNGWEIFRKSHTVDENDIALPHPLISQYASECLHLTE